MLVEVMAAGKPVVATRVGACAEVVADGETGLLVLPEAPHALAEAILYLIANPERSREMGEAGRRRVEAHSTVETTVHKHVELYQRLLAHPS